jgi:hypothetical protein
MIRIAPQEDEGLPSAETKATEPNNLFITRYQVKIGNSVYPLTPIESSRRAGVSPPSAGDYADVTAHSKNMLKTFTGGSAPVVASIQEDARQNFSPWYDVDNADNYEDLSLAVTRPLSILSGATPDSVYGFKQTRPQMISFQNHSSYEHERLDNSATGIDMRGIGSYTLELEIWEEGVTGHAYALVPPSKNYNLFITDVTDSILSVKRNAIDPSYQYAVY